MTIAEAIEQWLGLPPDTPVKPSQSDTVVLGKARDLLASGKYSVTLRDAIESLWSMQRGEARKAGRQ